MKVYAIPLADEAWKQYIERYGITPKGPILVEVFSRHDDFAVRTVGLQGMTGALGACFGRVVTMDSPNARPPGDFSWQATLWHELAHVFSLQASDARVPRWLTEGISVYEEHRRNPAWGRELSLEFAHQYGKGENFGVRKLPDAFKDVRTLSFAYFESALLVEHLVALNGEQGLRRLLRAYADGAKDADAFSTAFGKSIDDVEKSFGDYLNTEFGKLRDAMADPPRKVEADDLAGLKARAAEAPNNYLSQMSLANALIRADDLEAAREPLERAAALAPEAQGEGNPRARLAAIVAPTDPARARQLLRELLKWDHTNVVAARLLAKLAREANADDEEDFALQLVSDLDPFDAETHTRLGARLFAKQNYARALTEFQATVALGPVNVADAQTNVAEALLKLGRRDEARRAALAALKEAPTYSRAQDALMAASAR
jgi:tetratricopeptide (TPR) repeat protein